MLPVKGEGGFWGPNRRQSKPHSLARGYCSLRQRQWEIRGAEFGNEKEGNARLERKHVVRQRRERRRALSPRVIWSTPVPPVIARVPMSRASPPSQLELRVFLDEVKPYDLSVGFSDPRRCFGVRISLTFFSFFFFFLKKMIYLNVIP